MNTNENIGQLIKKLAGKSGGKSVMRLGVAEAVDMDTRTCTLRPLDGGPDLFGVKLQAVKMEGAPEIGMVIEPVDGSVVLAANVQDLPLNYSIVSYSEIANFYVFSAGKVVLKSADGIQLNEGDHGGLVVVADLVSKLNGIEQDLNTLKNIFSAWVPTPQDGGAALKGALAAYVSQTLQPTQIADLENPDVTH